MLEGLSPHKHPSHVCGVERERRKLEPKDQTLLDLALGDPAWSSNQLYYALRSRGVKIGEKALRKHRTQSCECYSNEDARESRAG